MGGACLPWSASHVDEGNSDSKSMGMRDSSALVGKSPDHGVGCVEVMVKEELCEKVVEVRRVSDRVMTAVVVLEEDVLKLICGYALQSGRTLEEKQSFYD